MSNSVKEKPQDLEGSKTQGQVKVNASNKYIPDLCPLPVTPNGCPIVAECECRPPKSGEAGSNLRIEFNDFNHQGKRPESGIIRLIINPDFNENASNRILACLSFFKWNGQEYIPVSLIEGHDDLKYVVLGNITECQFESYAEQEREALAYIGKERRDKEVIE